MRSARAGRPPMAAWPVVPGSGGEWHCGNTTSSRVRPVMHRRTHRPPPKKKQLACRDRWWCACASTGGCGAVGLGAQLAWGEGSHPCPHAHTHTHPPPPPSPHLRAAPLCAPRMRLAQLGWCVPHMRDTVWRARPVAHRRPGWCVHGARHPVRVILCQPPGTLGARGRQPYTCWARRTHIYVPPPWRRCRHRCVR